MEPDRIELATVVPDRTPVQVWPQVSEPGWFVNEGVLVDHEIEWDGATATVTDPGHGRFRFGQLKSEQPAAVAYSSRDGSGSMRVVQFDLVAVEEGTLVRVVESGFSTGNGSTGDRVAQHAQNTRTWLQQLDLLREGLAREQDRGSPGRLRVPARSR